MWQALLAAVGAADGVTRLQGVVRSAAVAASLGMFTLWQWRHCFLPVSLDFHSIISNKIPALGRLGDYTRWQGRGQELC